jgi:hypothetical protein
MVTSQKPFAILPADIDLAPEVPSLVDGRRLLYAEEEEASVWMVTLEEERIQLSHAQDHV